MLEVRDQVSWVLPHGLGCRGMPGATSGPTSRFDGQTHRVCLFVPRMVRMKIVSLRLEMGDHD